MLYAYKFLVVHLNNKLDRSYNPEVHYRKGQSRMFFLMRLSSFNMDTRLLQMFYHSVVASAIFLTAVCWGGERKASSVVGMELDSVEVVTD